MRVQRFFLLSLLALFLNSPVLSEENLVKRGRYLVVITGCNDCHTAGYAVSGGKIPEIEWLKGDPIGWHGPWGTSYGINLRNLVSNISKEAWILLVKNSQARPPMPTYMLKEMTNEDLEAIYHYIRSLGAAGDNMPAPLPPGEIPKTPYINFAPVIPGRK